MEITEKEIKHLASLSKLEFNSEELSRFSTDFQKIVEYVNELNVVDTAGAKDHVKIKEIDELRADVVAESLSNELALKNAAKKQSGAFVCSKVVD